MNNLFNVKVEKIFGIGVRQTRTQVHLSRKRFIFSFVLSLIKAKNVQFPQISRHLNDQVKVSSNIRRIQRFFKNYRLDYIQIAILLMSFIPKRKLRLCIDRTNWRFGKQNINFLALTVYYHGIGIPVLFEPLNKKGNSNKEERSCLLNKFVRIFGKKRLKSIVCDREFVGYQWFNYLLKHQLGFHIRIPKSYTVLYKGRPYRAEQLVPPKGEVYLENVLVNGVKVHIALKKDKEDDLIVITNRQVKEALWKYKKRWSIEVFFQTIKGRGFDFEATHLKELPKLKMLFALVAMAFTICLIHGIFKNDTQKKITIKNHGYKASSFFRYGLDKIQEVLDRIYFLKKEFEEIINLVELNICFCFRNIKPVLKNVV